MVSELLEFVEAVEAEANAEIVAFGYAVPENPIPYYERRYIRRSSKRNRRKDGRPTSEVVGRL